MVQGTVIGVVGTLVGALLGMFAAVNVSSWIAALERLIGHKFRVPTCISLTTCRPS